MSGGYGHRQRALTELGYLSLEKLIRQNENTCVHMEQVLGKQPHK